MKREIIHYEARQEDEDHEDLGKPFRVKAVIRNNRLIRAREQMGFETAAAAARGTGVHHTAICAYEGFKLSPWSKLTGDWTVTAKKLAEAYAYSPEELWPEVIREVHATAMVLELGSGEVEALSPERLHESAELHAAVEKALKTLPPRHEEVLRLRFGLDDQGEGKDLAEVGKTFELSRERIRQIEIRALRELRGQRTGRREGAKILADFKDREEDS